jgi:hypothetical protein
MTEKKSSFHHDTGKGSRPRSYSVTFEEYDKNWDAIFGKKEAPKEEVVAATVVEAKDAAEG